MNDLQIREITLWPQISLSTICVSSTLITSIHASFKGSSFNSLEAICLSLTEGADKQVPPLTTDQKQNYFIFVNHIISK